VVASRLWRWLSCRLVGSTEIKPSDLELPYSLLFNNGPDYEDRRRTLANALGVPVALEHTETNWYEFGAYQTTLSVRIAGKQSVSYSRLSHGSLCIILLHGHVFGVTNVFQLINQVSGL
jgi:hypothetical protein